jgi:ribosomal protein S18 acetylase RimI-like enzyme
MKYGESERYEIRPASIEDVGELVRMRLSLQKHMQDNNEALWKLSEKKIARFADFYRDQIKDERARLLVVQDKESRDIVGMGLGRIWQHDDYIPNTSGRIDDVWVEPDHRRKGLSVKIVAELLTFFSSNNIDCLTLDYAQGNLEAESVWRRLGFRTAIITATAKLHDVENSLLKVK